jgi:type IV pilus assembly protein PilM
VTPTVMSMLSILGLKKKNSYLGMEITDTRIKIAEVVVTAGRKPYVTKVINELLPHGTVEDGRILNSLSLVQVIKTLIQLNDFTSKQVHMVVPSQVIMVRQLKLPDLPDKQLRKVLEFEVKHNIHLPFDKPYFDFINLNGKQESPAVMLKRKPRKLPEASDMAMKEAAVSTDGGSHIMGAAPTNLFADFEGKGEIQQKEAPKAEVLLVAAPGELIMEYAGILKECGLKAIGAEIKAFSILRVLNETAISSMEETFLAVDINETVSDISIFHRGQLKITRSVPVNLDIEKTNLTPEEEVFAAFLNTNLSQDGEFQNACGDLAHEMERLMNFYRYTLNNRDQEFHTIVLSGDIGRLNEAAKYLEERLNQTVKLIQTEQIESSIPGFIEILPQIAVPVGLGMRGSVT